MNTNRDPHSLDNKIRTDIERRVQELDAEKEKWLQILRVLKGGSESEPPENKPSTPATSSENSSQMTNIEVVEAAMKSLSPKEFDIESVYRAVQKLPYPEAARLTRYQVRNAFRKIVVRPDAPTVLARKGVGSTGDYFYWKGT
jgi:hypothetical protein